jgi:hypothetical protein
MIAEDEFRSAGYRDMTDIIRDKFTLRFEKFMRNVSWEHLKKLADERRWTDAFFLFPSYATKIVLQSYTASLALNADGDSSVDKRVLVMRYTWNVDGQMIEFFVGTMNNKVSIVSFVNEQFVERLLESDGQLKLKLERDVSAMFQLVN